MRQYVWGVAHGKSWALCADTRCILGFRCNIAGRAQLYGPFIREENQSSSDGSLGGYWKASHIELRTGLIVVEGFATEFGQCFALAVDID